MLTKTILSTMDEHYFQSGYFAAFRDHEQRCGNPHPAGTARHEEWDSGWLLAHNLDEFRDPVEGSLRAQEDAIVWRN